MIKLRFSDLTRQEFDRIFVDDASCLEWLAARKWAEGYVCRKCGHDNHCRGRKPFSKRCTRCKHEESATAHTPFHRCRIPLREAFHMAWICCHSPAITTATLSQKTDIRQMTCWKFRKKILECIDNPTG